MPSYVTTQRDMLGPHSKYTYTERRGGNHPSARLSDGVGREHCTRDFPSEGTGVGTVWLTKPHSKFSKDGRRSFLVSGSSCKELESHQSALKAEQAEKSTLLRSTKEVRSQGKPPPAQFYRLTDKCR